MALILQIETSTTVCSVALSENGKCIALKELNERNIHASSITVFIEEVMKIANRKFAELNAVAIAMGPGSYTGLRIGVSTAKGLCYALNIPLIAINTLEMMVEGYLTENKNFDGLVVPMLDARRMEVFAGVWKNATTVIAPTAAVLLDENTFENYLNNQKLVFIGDGAPKFFEVMKHENAKFDFKNYNSAAYLSSLAYQKFNDSKFEDVAYFEPFYLKDFMVTTPKKKL